MSGTWNYRVVRRLHHDEATEIFRVHEVHYQDDAIVAWSRDPIDPYGESPDELAKDLELMVAAFNRPVLDLVDLPGYSPADPVPGGPRFMIEEAPGS